MKVKLIHEDKRGKIFKVRIGKINFNVMTRKKGTLMSGDYHPHNQFDVVLKGSVKITLKKEKEEEEIVKKANEFIKIPSGIPHMFEALEDTILLEWWDGPYEQKIYKPYRKIVESSIVEKTSD